MVHDQLAHVAALLSKAVGYHTLPLRPETACEMIHGQFLSLAEFDNSLALEAVPANPSTCI